MADYASHFDIPYPGATDPRQALDLFITPQANHDSPLIVFIHGEHTSLQYMYDSAHSYRS